MRHNGTMRCPYCAKHVERQDYWQGWHACSAWESKRRDRDYSEQALDTMLAKRKTRLRLTTDDIFSRKQVVCVD